MGGLSLMAFELKVCLFVVACFISDGCERGWTRFMRYSQMTRPSGVQVQLPHPHPCRVRDIFGTGIGNFEVVPDRTSVNFYG
ncbi:uncharacterized protein METZ01_LOCUS465113 [marine metagenome]|uniref:Uncharacterized protein n=1 Tax=marine metagenome TaxID=408172 RepID=A0A383AXJ3_9ZZZZ